MGLGAAGRLQHPGVLGRGRPFQLVLFIFIYFFIFFPPCGPAPRVCTAPRLSRCFCHAPGGGEGTPGPRAAELEGVWGFLGVFPAGEMGKMVGEEEVGLVKARRGGRREIGSTEGSSVPPPGSLQPSQCFGGCWGPGVVRAWTKALRMCFSILFFGGDSRWDGRFPGAEHGTAAFSIPSAAGSHQAPSPNFPN